MEILTEKFSMILNKISPAEAVELAALAKEFEFSITFSDGDSMAVLLMSPEQYAKCRNLIKTI